MSQAGSSQDSSEQWFALYVKFRYERVVSDFLLKKGYEAFSPSYPAEKECRGKIHKTDTPLFPGYVFAFFNPQLRMPVLTTPGVREVVGYGKTPIPIATEEINQVREAVNSKLRVEPCPYLETGERVKITRGPLMGLEGILEESRSSCRVIVSVSLIQRSIRVEVDRAMISAADKSWEPTGAGDFKRASSQLVTVTYHS